MVAQYDWEGQRNDDLSFKKGDLISVVERCEDPGWLIGEVIRDDEEGSSVRGMFPESFCDPFQEDADSQRQSPSRQNQTRRKSPSNVNCFRNKYVALTRKIETERRAVEDLKAKVKEANSLIAKRKEMARASDTAREKRDIEKLMDKRQKLRLSIKTCQRDIENLMDRRQKLGRSIQICQQTQSETLLGKLKTTEDVKFYWDVDNLYTMKSVINGKRRDSKFKSKQDSIPLPKYPTKWFPGVIYNIQRDVEMYLIEILVNDDDTYKRIRLPDSNYVYEYYDGYLNPPPLTWSIDFRRIEREGIVTICINPKHVMANSHWYGLPWVTDIWERSLPIRLESN